MRIESKELLQPEDIQIIFRDDVDGEGVRTLVARPAHCVLGYLDRNPFVDTPTKFTIQMNAEEHLVPSPDFLRLINHSCNPSVQFDVESLALVSLRPLSPGDELTFFYPSTEWEMTSPFACHCGASNCIGYVSGAANIPDAVLEHYYVAPHIRNELSRRQSPAEVGMDA